jgi:hypothetical protein
MDACQKLIEELKERNAESRETPLTLDLRALRWYYPRAASQLYVLNIGYGCIVRSTTALICNGSFDRFIFFICCVVRFRFSSFLGTVLTGTHATGSRDCKKHHVSGATARARPDARHDTGGTNRENRRVRTY